MNFFKGLFNSLILMACFVAIMYVPQCEAANTDDYMPVSAAWGSRAVVVKPDQSFGDDVDCVIVDADREIIDRQFAQLDWRRSVTFRSPQAIDFGALAYCREVE